jgi:DNA-binding transcriptional regulator YhcF (GntR family)
MLPDESGASVRGRGLPRPMPLIEAPVHALMLRELLLEIASGQFAEGAAIPSARHQALRKGVHVMTAARAGKQLQRLGLLERRRGQRHTVRVGAQQLARALIAQDLAASGWPQIRAGFAALGATEAVAAGDLAIGAFLQESSGTFPDIP